MKKILNQYFDHSLLGPETKRADIAALCADAIKYNFFGIAINPYWVRGAHQDLSGSDIKIISVSGFPLSANRTKIKIAEAVCGVEDGADEIDMVANIGLLAMGEYQKVESEIFRIKNELPTEVLLKVIIEAPKISEVAQIEAVKVVVNAGADYVKTATGFFGEATVETVARLHTAADGKIKVKASGGIRDLKTTDALIKAGAERIGSSASVAIMKEYFALEN